MKILLIKPPKNPTVVSVSLYEPLELEYLAASVRGHDVRILDMRIDRNLHAELLKFGPELVGVTAYTCDYNNTIKILKEVKEFDSSIKIVVGGHHVTFLPGDFDLPYVDVIFLGYADFTFPRYVNALSDHEKIRDIPNIGIINTNGIFYTRKETSAPDLDALPFPDRSLTLKYRKHYHDPIRNKMALIMTSRGCLFRCNFCSCWKLMDGKYSARTPESIIEELKGLHAETDLVYFSDDNTFHDIDRMWKLSRLLRENNLKKKLQMYARADTIVRHQDLFEELAGSGLQFLTIGLESFNDNDIRYYNKKTSVKLNDQAIAILKNLNIYILAHFIIRPEYTREDFKQLINYVYQNNLFRPVFPVLTPLPGTELYNETCNSFEIKNYDYFDFAHSILPTRLDPRDFYHELTNLYKKSFSIVRILKHRFYRFFKLKGGRYFTDNTDGITALKLLRVFLFSLGDFIKLRSSTNDLNQTVNIHISGLSKS